MTFDLEHCGCRRTLPSVPLERLGGVANSTCSRDSYMRGPGQRTIGFSFYGDPKSAKGKERKYFEVRARPRDRAQSWVFKDYSNQHSDLCRHENRFLGLTSA